MAPQIPVLVTTGESVLTQGGPGGLIALLVLFCATLLWMGLALWAMRQRWRALAIARRFSREEATAQAILSSADAGFLLYDRLGGCVLGGEAHRFLHLAMPVSTLDDLVSDDKDVGIGTLDVRTLSEWLHNSDAKNPLVIETRDGHVLHLSEAEGYVDPEQKGRRLFWIKDRTVEHSKTADIATVHAKGNAKIARLRALIDAAPYPVWLRDRDMRLILANRAYVEAVEQPDEETVLRNEVDIVENALTGSSRDGAKRAHTVNKAVRERHFAVIAGQRQALSLSHVPLDNMVAGFAVDVTEAEEKRAELARLLDGHGETLNKLSSPVAIFDTEQRLQFYNSAFARLFRLSEDWLSEHPVHANLIEAMREKRRLPEQADFSAWRSDHLALHNNPEPTEEMWHLPDSSTLRMMAQPHPLGGLLLLFEDVTDRLALESSYNTLIAVQRETLNNLHEGVAVFGSDGRLKLFNPNYARIWNLDTEHLHTEPHYNDILEASRPLLQSGDDWATLKHYLVHQMQERKSHTGRWYRPDGSVLDYAIVPLPDGRILITYIDVTDSFRIEHALRERNEALETADRLKSEFVANMSYELRTPLNSIIGFTEMLMSEISGPLVEKQRNYLDYVLSAAGDLRDLIDDILDLAVIEAGAMTLDIKAVSVVDLVENCLSLGREEARKSGLKLKAELAPGCGQIEGDQRRLTQALFNLVGNAIKFTPPGGDVCITARPAGKDHVELIVDDTGLGISSDDQEQAFKKFNTGTSLHGRKGVGLGLSLVQSFITLHNGTVTLVSTPNIGTTITCRLPRHQANDNIKKVI